MDVLQLLKKDHVEVVKLFQRFRADRGRGRKAVVDDICRELEVHTHVEEEIFYPAVRETGDPALEAMVDEALREHDRAKQQLARIREHSRRGEGDELDGLVSTLEQDIEHHVGEEEGEMFPRVELVIEREERASIGRRARDRKASLLEGGGRSERRARRRRTTAARRRRAGAQRAKGARKRTAKTKTAKRSRARKRARSGTR